MTTKPDYYVYALIDPRDGKAFYIGKGSGDRMYQHVKDTRNGIEPNAVKGLRIMGIIKSGNKVVEKKLRWFDFEDDAYLYEYKLIARLKKNLANVSYGSAVNTVSKKAELMLSRIMPYNKWVLKIKGTKREEFAMIGCDTLLQSYEYITDGLKDLMRRGTFANTMRLSEKESP